MDKQINDIVKGELEVLLDQENAFAADRLSELQLSYVGGGIGDTVL